MPMPIPNLACFCTAAPSDYSNFLRILSHSKDAGGSTLGYCPVTSRRRLIASEQASPSNANGLSWSSRIAQDSSPEAKAGKNCSKTPEIGASLLGLSERRIRVSTAALSILQWAFQHMRQKESAALEFR